MKSIKARQEDQMKDEREQDTTQSSQHGDTKSDSSRRRFLIGSAGAIAAGSAMGLALTMGVSLGYMRVAGRHNYRICS